MRYAGVWHRFVAVLIDGAVFVALALAIGLLAGGVHSNRINGTYEVGIEDGSRATLVLLLLFLAYYVICEAVFGRTIGKRLVGLRVVDGSGRHIGLGASLVRNLLRIVDGLFFYFVAAAAVWSSPRRQRLGDRAAGTYVVRGSGYVVPERPKRRPSRHEPYWVTGSDWQGTYSRDDFMADVDRANHLSASRIEGSAASVGSRD
jgi:uncharacterized RDD family membrane protein YckC